MLWDRVGWGKRWDTSYTAHTNRGGARVFAWRGGGAKCLVIAAAIRESPASPEKADEWGGGGGGDSTHFLPRLQKFPPKLA